MTKYLYVILYENSNYENDVIWMVSTPDNVKKDFLEQVADEEGLKEPGMGTVLDHYQENLDNNYYFVVSDELIMEVAETLQKNK